MDFKLTEDQQAFQKTARDFAQSELPEAAQICETEASPPVSYTHLTLPTILLV